MLLQAVCPRRIFLFPSQFVLSGNHCQSEIEVCGHIEDPLLTKALMHVIRKTCTHRLISVQEKHCPRSAIEMNRQTVAQVVREVIEKLISDCLAGLRIQLKRELASKPGGQKLPDG